MKIYGNNTELTDVYLRENSYLFEEIKGDNIAVLSFDALNPIELTLNDYILIDDEKYKIRHPEQIKKEETSLGYNYTVTFYSDQYDLRNTAFFLFGQPERKKLHDTYNGTAKQVLDLIVLNMNRNDSGWSAGSCIETQQRTFDFKDMNCSDVLDRIASEYETEYRVKNKKIFIGEIKYPSGGLVLGQGSGMGFKRLEVTAVNEAPPVTVLFPYGSDKNIGAEYGSDYLVLPDGQAELTKNVSKYGRFELSKQFEHIFPHGEFHVSDKTDDFTLCASDIDFNITDCLLDGVEVIVTFLDGQLAGYDLAVVDGSWKNDIKQFKLKVNERENALKVPGDINFNIGDKFILTGLKMPQSYTDKAEQQLLSEAREYLDKYAEKQIQVQGKCDDILFKKLGISIEVGQTVNVYSEKPDINREIRVTAVKKYLENDDKKPYRYEITLADFVSGGGFKQLLNEVRNNLPAEIDNRFRGSVEFTKRRFRDAMETFRLLENALLNFTGAINPITVHTMSLLVGDESLQYRFVDNTTNPQQVRHVIAYDSETKVLKCPAGIIQHMTIGIKDISSRHIASDCKFWDITAFDSPAMTDAEARYLYIKAGKADNTGVFVLSETAIGMESESGYYHFLTGILNSEFDGTRSFVELYGFTEILPGRITTDRVVSADGQNFLDFVNNAFKVGNINNYLEWNKNGDGVLRIKGSIVQSAGGDESPLGCFRGEYNPAFVYYNGDEVTYKGSSYRYIYNIPYSGKIPTDTDYWILIASRGESGSFTSFVFKASDTKPATPSGTAIIPSGWADAPTDGASVWWMSKSTVSYDDGQWTAGTWSVPVKVTGEDGDAGEDGKFWDYKYRTAATQPATPTGLQPSGWTDAPPTVTSGNFLWMTYCEKNAAQTQILWGWSTPVRISGEKGQDGVGAVLNIAADNQVFKYNNTAFTGTPTPTTINLRADVPSGAGSVTWYYLNGVQENYVSSGQTLAIPYNSSYLAGISVMTFRAKCTWNGQTLSDEITIVKLGDGTDSYTVLLTNESHTVACDSSGNPASGELNSSKSSTSALVYRGTTQLTAASNPGTGTYSISVQSTTGCTATISGAIVYVTAMSADGAQVNISINCEGKQTFTKVMSLTKSKAGANGTNGTNGDYFEYRYTKYGSSTTAPAINANTSNPSTSTITWTTEIPALGSLEYLWMTIAKKSSAGTLLQNWSTPIRANGVDGAKGADGSKGDTGPSVVFRGIYDNAATYYGTNNRVDCVKYNGTYYVARTDAGNGFTGTVPTNTEKWNTFGAQFDSVATGLLLAELAYIENLIVGRLCTGTNDSLPRLLASGSDVALYSNKADEGNSGHALVRIGKDVGIMQVTGGSRPGINIRDYYGDGKSSELTSAGLFTNGSNITAVPAGSFSSLFSIASLLQRRTSGNSLLKSVNAAVYGNDQTNDSDAGYSEGYGGYFNKLRANGLYLNTIILPASYPDGHYWTTKEDVVIIWANTSEKTVLLPKNQYAGRTLFVKKGSTGRLNIRAEDSTCPIYTNQVFAWDWYWEIPDGNTVMCIWSGGNWLVSKMTI